MKHKMSINTERALCSCGWYIRSNKCDTRYDAAGLHLRMAECEDALVEKMAKMVGYVPIGTRDLLHILTHPDLIDYTRDFIKSCEGN